MICIVCKRPIERSYGAPGLIGCYCQYCATAKGLTPEQILKSQYEQAINEVIEENKRLRATNENLQSVVFKQEDTMQMIAQEKQACFDELVILKAENERWKADNEELYKEMSERIIEERKIEVKLTLSRMQERLKQAFHDDGRSNWYVRKVIDQVAEELRKEIQDAAHR